jgi:hypothetical protein
MKQEKTFGIGFLTIVCAIILIFCGSSYAQPPWAGAEPGEATQKMFMEVEDQNGDGEVLPDECGCPPDHFQIFDKNGDGKIVLEEAPKSVDDIQ